MSRETLDDIVDAMGMPGFVRRAARAWAVVEAEGLLKRKLSPNELIEFLQKVNKSMEKVFGKERA